MQQIHFLIPHILLLLLLPRKNLEATLSTMQLNHRQFAHMSPQAAGQNFLQALHPQICLILELLVSNTEQCLK